MKIAVLAGGLSPERDVSLTSGSIIANTLIQSGHQAALIDLYFGIEEELTGNLDDLFHSKADFSYTIPEKAPDLAEVRQRRDRLLGGRNGFLPDALIGPHVLEICAYADMTFLALHGSAGENGQLQATLDTHGIPYTGSSYDGCLLAMDKDITKRLLRAAGVETADWLLFRCGGAPDIEKMAEETAERIGLPCVVKPVGCGSSVGVSLADDISGLREAVRGAFLYEKQILIEKKITGREFSCGVLGEAALPPIEIQPLHGFYDYKNKYQNGMTQEICPAPLTEAQTNAICEAALRVHHALRLSVYSRSDFILDENTGRFVCLEANTLPGMTPASLIPQEAAAAGISYADLCERILELSRWKYQR